MSASIHRVQRILRWFESQQQLVFYASSLLFVYEGLPSPSSSSSASSSSSSLSSLLSTLSISPTVGKTAALSLAADSSWEGKARPEGAKLEEEVGEYNNNNIQVHPWDCSLATIYTNHTKKSHHHCARGHLRGNHGDSNAVETTAGPVPEDNISALCEEDNSTWKRTGESQPANGNRNKSQVKGQDDEGGREGRCQRRQREEDEDGETKGRECDATDGGSEDTEVEVRMIDFAHVFPSESPDHGYIYGLKHLLTVLEQILCDAA